MDNVYIVQEIVGDEVCIIGVFASMEAVIEDNPRFRNSKKETAQNGNSIWTLIENDLFAEEWPVCGKEN